MKGKTILIGTLTIILLLQIQSILSIEAATVNITLKCMDVRPGIYVVYEEINGKTLINVTYHSLGEYHEEPQINVTIKINNNDQYWSIFSLRNRELINGTINEWKYYPLWIPKGLKVNSEIEVYQTNFRVIEVDEEKITISNQTLTLVYDKFSGAFISGDLVIKNTRYQVRLKKTNMYFRRKLFQDLYFDWEKLTEYLLEINTTSSNIGKILVYSIGKSCLERDIWACEIPARKIEKAVIVVDGGMHGSEAISVKSAIHIIEKVLEEYSEIENLDYITLIIIPMLNPDGVEASKFLPAQPPILLKYARCNARGVDLNRNFAHGWSEGGSTDYERPDYRGIAPETEPEVLTLLKVFKTRNVRFYINLHSGISATLIPGYERNPYRELYTNEIARGIANIFNHLIARGRFYGGSANWIIFAYERDALSIIIELYGNREQLKVNWFNFYNPTTSIEANEACENAYYSLLYIMGKTLTWIQEIEESSKNPSVNQITILIAVSVIIAISILVILLRMRKATSAH